MAERRSKPTAMRVTAIRVSADLQRLIEREAARVGVSFSQYVREAALARAAAAAAARGEEPFETLAQGAPDGTIDAAVGRLKRDLRHGASEARSDARALRAQSAQAVRRAGELTSDASGNAPAETGRAPAEQPG